MTNQAIKYPTTRVPSLLYNLGVSYHASGVLIDSDGNKTFDYYKVDKVDPDHVKQLLQIASGFRVMYIGSKYVPEQTKPILCFPKAAYWRLNK